LERGVEAEQRILDTEGVSEGRRGQIFLAHDVIANAMEKGIGED
jgi:hypothetical protein